MLQEIAEKLHIDEDSINATEDILIQSIIEKLSQNYNEDDYDMNNVRSDLETNNFSLDDIEDYLKQNIIEASLINGQFKQAEQQAKDYDFEPTLVRKYFNKNKSLHGFPT